MNTNFTTDSRTQQWLNSLAVQCEYRESVHVSELVDSWNRDNMGRPRGAHLVEKAIVSYTERMQAGSQAPAVIVRNTPTGKVEILDGVQRISSSIRTGSQSFAAYVVTCSELTARKIRIAANVQGTSAAPVPEDWALAELVKAFVLEGDDTIEDVAAVAGRSVAAVRTAHDRLVTTQRITRVCEGAVNLKTGIIDAISKYSVEDDFEGRAGKTTAKMIRLLKEVNFSNGDTSEYIKEFFSPAIKASKNRATQLNTQLNKMLSQPIIQAALAKQGSGRKRDAATNINKHFVTLLNAVREHKKRRCPFDDMALVSDWDRMYGQIGQMLRKDVSDDLLASNPDLFLAQQVVMAGR